MCSSPNSNMTICGYRNVIDLLSLDETMSVGPCIDIFNVLAGKDTRKCSFSLCYVRTWKEDSYLQSRRVLRGANLAGLECFLVRWVPFNCIGSTRTGNMVCWQVWSGLSEDGSLLFSWRKFFSGLVSFWEVSSFLIFSFIKHPSLKCLEKGHQGTVQWVNHTLH